MTAAIFGLIGVLVGGILNGVVAHWLDNRRDFRAAVISARLVRHELELVRGDFEHFFESGRGSDLPVIPIKHPAWARYRESLARVLPAPDWEMVSAGYTWIELHNTDPPLMAPEDDLSEDAKTFYADILTEMRGSLISLLPLQEGRRNRVGLKLRWRRWQHLRRQMY